MKASEKVLFDLDGTLIDSTELILQGFHHTWESWYGYRPRDAAIIATIGMVLPEAMARLAAEGFESGSIRQLPGTDELGALVDRYRNFHRTHHDALIRSYPGVGEMLQSLRSAGLKLGVVTSKGRWSSERALELFHLRDHFNAVIAAEDCERHKPHPEPVHRALAALSTSSGRAALVGDSVHDIRSGKAAGVVTVAAMWGPTDSESLRQAQADYYVETPREITELLSSASWASRLPTRD